MAKYILSKKAKGKKYQYTVTDEKGNVISTRTSARDYVACTANGEFYFGRLDLNPRQKQYFADTIAVAKRVDIVRAADVFNDYELEIIRDILKPQPQQCYRNAHLLCQLFPERVRYCEGKTFAFIPIEHAFNRVGDKYVDITFEFALQDAELLEHEYVVFGEYDLRTLERITRKTGYYGDIYRNIYIERVKVTPDAMK